MKETTDNAAYPYIQAAEACCNVEVPGVSSWNSDEDEADK